MFDPKPTPRTWPRRLLIGAILAASACNVAGLTPAESDPIAPVSPPPPPPPPPAPGYTYQFGAKFEPPVGRVVHGIGQWDAFNVKYFAMLPASAQPASELVFIPIGDTIRPWNPAKIAASLAAMRAAGRMPLADIALRGNQPTQAELAQLPDPLFGIDHEVANGTKWDSRLVDLAQLFAAHKTPVLLRIGGEFSGWWNGYHPYEYPKAFRKIVNLFRAAGAGNVAFVWCYEPAAPGDFAAVNAKGEPKWYPGADVVDWFSIDLFAQGDVSGPLTALNGVPTSFGKTTAFLDFAVASGKPVVIAESAPAHYDLGVPSGASAAWSQWFTPYFDLIASRSGIKWFVYVNYDWSLASYYALMGWQNNDLSLSAVAGLYASEITKSKYLHAGELAQLKDFGLYK